MRLCIDFVRDLPLLYLATSLDMYAVNHIDVCMYACACVFIFHLIDIDNIEGIAYLSYVCLYVCRSQIDAVQ